VIGIITPVTHSIPTLSANAINMIASGNTIVGNPHPSATNCAAHAVREYNKAIAAKFGIENAITLIVPPTLESAEAIFNHRGIQLLVVTGGPAVARAALTAKKRAIVAGPGNPPVVVDETACLENAAKSIVAGAAFDNNLLCIGEKQVFCVASAFDQLMTELTRAGGYILNSSQIDALTKQAMPIDPKDGKPHVNKDLWGRMRRFWPGGGCEFAGGRAAACGRDKCFASVRADGADDAIRSVRAGEKCERGDRSGD